MKDRMLTVIGGAAGSLWQAFHNAIADNDWLIKIVIGAMVGTIISILLNEIYRGIKRLLKKDKYLNKHVNIRERNKTGK